MILQIGAVLRKPLQQQSPDLIGPVPVVGTDHLYPVSLMKAVGIKMILPVHVHQPGQSTILDPFHRRSRCLLGPHLSRKNTSHQHNRPKPSHEYKQFPVQSVHRANLNLLNSFLHDGHAGTAAYPGSTGFQVLPHLCIMANTTRSFDPDIFRQQ